MSSTHTVMTSLLIPQVKECRPCKLKLAILGDKHVGKTSLLTRYVRGMFNPTYIHTAGGDISHKNVHIGGVEVHLTLIDSAGHKYVRSLIKSLYRNVHGIMVVYDVTRLHTFESLDNWLKQIKMVNTENPFIMLVGNKKDLIDHTVVAPSRAEQYAEQRELPWCEVSAKTGDNVLVAFNWMVTETFNAKMPIGTTMGSIHLGKSEEEQKPEKKSALCLPC